MHSKGLRLILDDSHLFGVIEKLIPRRTTSHCYAYTPLHLFDTDVEFHSTEEDYARLASSHTIILLDHSMIEMLYYVLMLNKFVLDLGSEVITSKTSHLFNMIILFTTKNRKNDKEQRSGTQMV